MKTILYDIAKQKLISSIFPDGYKVDGVSALLPEGIVELEVVESERPDFDSETQRLSSEWVVDLEANQYRLEFYKSDLSAYEIAMKDWAHPQFAKRIIAPKQLVLDDIGIKMLGWFQINNFPVDPNDTHVYLYCNVILPEHEQIIDSLQGIVTIQDRPVP